MTLVPAPGAPHGRKASAVVAAFYQFARLDDLVDLKLRLKAVCEAQDVRGIIVLAGEGINATIAGSRTGVDAVLSWLRAQPALADLSHKEGVSEGLPFHRLKIDLKSEIVTFRQPGVDPTRQVGVYVKPLAWNALIADPDVVVVDTRNDFEVAVGTFEGAINPHTSSFSEFPAFVSEHLDPKRHQKVAMFCTGGIRCEKASAWLLSQGFSEVFHLEGGILKYLEEIPAAESRWRGECFVFDRRVTVGHQLVVGRFKGCHACYRPVDEMAQASPLYEEGVSCPRCHGTQTARKLKSLRDRQKQMVLAAERKDEAGFKVGPVERRST